MKARSKILLILFAVSVPPLLFPDRPYMLHIITVAIVWGLAASALNILTGMLGILDLGFVCYVGFGAYLDVVLTVQLGWSFWTSLVTVLAASSLLGVALACPLLRLRGHSASLVTLGYGLIFYQLVNNAGFLGGPNGTVTAGLLALNDFPGLGNSSTAPRIVSYLLTVLLVLPLIILLSKLSRRPLGRLWMATGDDEDLLPFFRLSPRFARFSSFAVAASIGGLAGMLLGRQMGYIAPGNFTLIDSVIILAAVLLGGRGNTIASALTGTALILLGEYLRLVGEWRLVLYGALLVLGVLYRQEGLWPIKIPTVTLPSTMPSRDRKKQPKRKPLPMEASVLRVKCLTKRFGALTALRRVNLTVCGGQKIGVIGPNGSGKTVLINTISGVYNADEGSLTIGNTSIDANEGEPLIRSMAGVSRSFQVSRLFPRLSVAEHVLLPLLTAYQHRNESIRERLKRWFLNWSKDSLLDASQILGMFGERLSSRANASATTLSFANRRRLEIARALATKPDFVLLDEPSSGMNAHETNELASDINRLPSVAVLLIEHKVNLIRQVADYVYCLDEGRIIAEGDVETVFASKKVRERFQHV